MILAAVLALLVGLLLGLLGGGGSILTLPALVYVVGLDPRDGVAASLLVVGVTSAAAMIMHARSGRVSWKVGAIFGAASMVGAYAGGRVSHLVPPRLLLAAFTALMLVTAVAMMRPRRDGERVTANLRGAALVRVLGVGVAIGALTGVIGAGGGFVIVPALALLCGLPIRSAVATSLFVIAMNSLAGFAGASAYAMIPWPVVGVMTAAAAIGGVGGAVLTTRVAPKLLRQGFAWFILAIGALMIWKQLPSSIAHGAAARLVVGCAFALVVGAMIRRALTRKRSPSEVA
jgi:uncharacterized membrane protein YfcA